MQVVLVSLLAGDMVIILITITIHFIMDLGDMDIVITALPITILFFIKTTDRVIMAAVVPKIEITGNMAPAVLAQTAFQTM
jgi:hypothetical protein